MTWSEMEGLDDNRSRRNCEKTLIKMVFPSSCLNCMIGELDRDIYQLDDRDHVPMEVER